MNSKSAIFTGKSPWLALFILILITVGLKSMLVPPLALPASIPAGEFSGERAFTLLAGLLAENQPHPAGSPENGLVRDRIVSRLEQLGLASEIQADFKCSTLAAGCAFVENITAIKKGSGHHEKAVLLTTHYDSVPGAPGAADAGAGVAAMLEIAENLNNSSTLQNDVILLFTDAEETGLRGAMAFADSNPLIQRVAIVLNMEARGSTGPSVMFETGANNLQQVKGFIQATSHPVATSLIVEIYKRMPNATDYTVYKGRDIPGLNYGFSHGVSLYHSSLDDLAHLDRGSLQHHGSNLLSVVRQFGNSDLAELESTQDATYVDVFGRTVIWWPANRGPMIAAVALILLLSVFVAVKGSGIRSLLWAFLAVILSLPAILILGWLASFPLGQFGDIHPLEHPYPWPARIALISIALAVGVWSGKLFFRRTNVESLFYVVWLLFTLIGLALALTITGAAYIFLIPAFAAALTAAVANIRRRSQALRWGAYAGLAVAAYMAVYHFLLLEVVFNFHLSHFRMIPLWLLALALMPVVAAWKRDAMRSVNEVYVTVSLLALVSLIVGAVVPLYTADLPRSVNLVYSQDVSNSTNQWQIETFGPEDHEYLSAAGFPDSPVGYHRHGRKFTNGYFIAAPDLGLMPPELTIINDQVSEGRRTLSGLVGSPRSAYTLGMSFADAESILTMSINGQLVLDGQTKELTGPRVVRLHGLLKQTANFEIVLRSAASFEIDLYDLGRMPEDPGYQRLKSIRPDNAAPMHFGDYSIVSKTFNF